MGGEFEGKWIHGYVSPETITTLFVDQIYLKTQQKKVYKKNKKFYTDTAVRLFMGSVYYSSMAKVLHLIKETAFPEKSLRL